MSAAASVPASRSRSPRGRREVGSEATEAAETTAETAAAPAAPQTAADLVAEASACLAALPPQVAEARELFERALALEPASTSVLDAFGAFLCEDGDCELATELLEQSVKLKPDEAAEKYLYLAQMANGERALAHYERGAGVLRRAAEATDEPKASASLRRQLARSHASMAELYMTDLCDLPEAESGCEAALEKGFDADGECLELLATRASLRKVQGRLEEAGQLALRVAKRVLASVAAEPGIFADEAAGGSSTGAGLAAESDTLADEDIVQLCRTLIDLGHAPEARGLLEMQLEKDEEDMQVWTLLGYCHVVERDYEAVRECANEALKLCKRLGKKEAALWRPGLRDLLARAKRLEAAEDPPEGVDGAAAE